MKDNQNKNRRIYNRKKVWGGGGGIIKIIVKDSVNSPAKNRIYSYRS